MDFDLSDDQREIRSVARDMLAARSPWTKVRQAAEGAAYDLDLWAEFVELGWPALAIGEEHGGQGLGAIELGVILEELGYACAASPLLSTATAAAVIQACGSPTQCERWLPALASGRATAGIGSRDLAADAEDASVIVLIDGDAAQLIARDDADVQSFAAIDATRRYATVNGGGEALGDGAADRVRAALASEVVGVCQRALDMSVEYVREREQFGVAVGSFQAVSHRCAQMLVSTEIARSTALYAAWSADADAGLLPEAAALASAAAATAAVEVTSSAIQAHGGIGFTWEADVHWLFKRAQLDAALIGSAKSHRAKLARLGVAKLQQRVAA